MWTKRIVLRIVKADGTEAEVPMRYNASHQRGWRCFIGSLADAPEQIKEDTPRSFEGSRLFDVLAAYRTTIEHDGWRLLHAAARRDCWAKPDYLSPSVYPLVPGVEHSQPIDAFEPAQFELVATLEEQHANFQAWMSSLAPVYVGRVRPRAGHEHDPPGVEFSALARLAGEYLVNGTPNLKRLSGKRR